MNGIYLIILYLILSVAILGIVYGFVSLIVRRELGLRAAQGSAGSAGAQGAQGAQGFQGAMSTVAPPHKNSPVASLRDLERAFTLAQLSQLLDSLGPPKPNPKPELHTFSAKRAFAVSTSSADGVKTLGAVLDEIRAAAEQGQLKCLPKSMTDVHRAILFYIGYGSCSDGSVHWSGMEKFYPDTTPSNISHDFTLDQFIENAENAASTPKAP